MRNTKGQNEEKDTNSDEKKKNTVTSDECYNEMGNDACCIAPVQWLLFTID